MPPKKPSAASSHARKGAAPKKRSAEKKAESAPPAIPIAGYVVIKSAGYVPDGFHHPEPPTISVHGVYPSEDQAYVAAIRRLVSDSERLEGGERADLRMVATTTTLSLKQRLKKLETMGDEEGEQILFRIKKTQIFPLETVNDANLLSGLKAECSEDEDSESRNEEPSECYLDFDDDGEAKPF